MVRQRLLFLLDGISDAEFSTKLQLGDGSVNLYPDGKGYLINYPGKKDLFTRDPGEQPTTDYIGTAPSVSNSYTVLESFVDFLGMEHLVFVYGADVCEKLGNGYKVLVTLKGKNTDGFYYPSMFIYEKKLVITNEGDPPYIWDGVEGVDKLGVQEVPSPPTPHLVSNPHLSNISAVSIPYDKGDVWLNFSEGMIETGPTNRKDAASNPINGMYSMCIQFVDRYGNKGKASSASNIISVENFNSIPAKHNRSEIQCEWIPPREDNHIHYVIQGRTLTLNPDDSAPLGSRNVMYEETYIEGTTMHRRMQRLSDEGLAARTPIDFDVLPPPSSIMGASFSGRIWLIDLDGGGWFSDLLLTGQYRNTQRINFYSYPVAIIPAGDRIFVIGRSSTEVYYEGNSGPSVLEVDTNNGSNFGGSFVSIGDGAIFGLWDSGFGFYDGKSHTFIDTPEFISSIFLDTDVDVSTARKIKDVYYLPARLDHAGTGNNVIIMYFFKSKSWYIIEDTVRDIVSYSNEIVGCDDSLYQMFYGGTYPVAKLRTIGLTSSVNKQMELSSMRLLMESSSISKVSFDLTGDDRSTYTVGGMFIHPSSRAGRKKYEPEYYWNSINELFPKDWQAPNDGWYECLFGKPIVGYSHRVNIDLPSGAPIRIKGIELGFSNPRKAEAE